MYFQYPYRGDGERTFLNFSGLALCLRITGPQLANGTRRAITRRTGRPRDFPAKIPALNRDKGLSQTGRCSRR